LSVGGLDLARRVGVFWVFVLDDDTGAHPERVRRVRASGEFPNAAARGIIAPMARIVFTPQLRRFTETPELNVPAATLRAALDAAFAVNPHLRSYVLDDQGHLRANVVAFIDGRRCADRVALDDRLRPDSEVHVLQALSGG
jgi:hypothetical protein